MTPSVRTKRTWTGNVRFCSKSFGRIGIEIEVTITHSTSPYREWEGKTIWIKAPKYMKDDLIRRGSFSKNKD